MIPDMSVKAAYNSLVKSLKKPPTSKNTLGQSLDISNVDWPTIYMIPQKVAIESCLRIFQYKILNNILFLNNRLFVQTSSDRFSPDYVHYVNVETKQPSTYLVSVLSLSSFSLSRLWDSIKSWLIGSITLPPLDPDTAILGH